MSDDNNLSPIVPGRPGRFSYSLEALREKIELQFQDETANRPDILLDLDTEAKRRGLLTEVADYILAVEAITLSIRDKAALIETAYRNLFTFGPLDDYLNDEQVTEITVNGPSDIHVRRDKLEAVSAAFDDRAHLAGILDRIAASAGAVLTETNPFLEIGVVLAGRPARIVAMAPPVNLNYSLEIRLHPRQPIPLEHLVTPEAADLLKTILADGYGLLIVGDVAMGKTTLASALIPFLSADMLIMVVERTAEMHLPLGVNRRAAIPAALNDPGSSFDAEILAALHEGSDWLVVDEIRGDESAAVWDGLTRKNGPRLLWVFRGTGQADRLRSALSMVIRKQNQTLDQDVINRAIAERLPFIVELKLIEGQPHLKQIAEWRLSDSGSLDLHPLLIWRGGQWETDSPQRALNWPLGSGGTV
jgi:pilus assembly protein CpaF